MEDKAVDLLKQKVTVLSYERFTVSAKRNSVCEIYSYQLVCVALKGVGLEVLLILSF